MLITRKILIEICNQFINGEIDKNDILNFASENVFDEDISFEDEIVDEIIFQWDNEIINFEINKKNMILWKEKLLNGNDELLSSNSWNYHIHFQKQICEKYNSEWKPFNKKLFVGISENYNLEPINGLRHSSEKGTSGWYIWFGEYSENKDFFKPICAEHLLEIYPKIIDYLGLEPGFRFLIDKNGYEDVWFDDKLLIQNN